MTIKLSDEERISLHRELWLWCSENPDKDKTDWPNWEMVDSSAHWVRLKKMHDLSLDKNNPAPFYGKVLMPRKFCGILWRLVALPILLVMCLLQSRWAKFQIKWLWFLILERGEIWKCSFKCQPLQFNGQNMGLLILGSRFDSQRGYNFK